MQWTRMLWCALLFFCVQSEVCAVRAHHYSGQECQNVLTLDSERCIQCLSSLCNGQECCDVHCCFSVFRVKYVLLGQAHHYSGQECQNAHTLHNEWWIQYLSSLCNRQECHDVQCVFLCSEWRMYGHGTSLQRTCMSWVVLLAYVDGRTEIPQVSSDQKHRPYSNLLGSCKASLHLFLYTHSRKSYKIFLVLTKVFPFLCVKYYVQVSQWHTVCTSLMH